MHSFVDVFEQTSYFCFIVNLPRRVRRKCGAQQYGPVCYQIKTSQASVQQSKMQPMYSNYEMFLSDQNNHKNLSETETFYQR